ncbi:MAG: penicillin acylase family protein [Anaerolineae bacterium]|jgi:penicillin amidase
MAVIATTLVTLLILLALAALGLFYFLRRPLPKTSGILHLPGLKAEVEVIRDRWGVPHIYAASEEDLFFAMGYVHAQDRMWQMEFQRRLAAGRLSEVIGEATLEFDRIFRILGLYRAAEADLAALEPDSRRTLNAYSTGVNAYLAAHPGRWSVEFSLLGFAPEPWKPADSLSWMKVMAWNMGCNWASELIRAHLAAQLGPELAVDLEPAYPDDNPTVVQGSGLPEGADTPPNGWGSADLRQALEEVLDLFGPAPNPPAAPASPGMTQARGNSNQWVVSGDRTASGQPLLSNDTHLLLGLPAAWYQVHLSGGGYDVTGVSLPGLPGFAVGHNEHCAWGITIAWQDAQDLYVERFHPDDPGLYEYEGEWLEAKVYREEIQVKGRAEPEIEEVVVTHHGPIISRLAGEDVSVALRWTALEPSDTMSGILRLSKAQTWDEFRAAVGYLSAPPLNFVYADREGNIGFVQAGRVPIRTQGYGLVPVPGWNGDHEWQGYLPLDELPQAYNPESGWLATANNLVVDQAYPHYLSADLENPARCRRIVDLITAQKGLTADDFIRFQLDTYSRQSQRFARHLLTIQPQSAAEARALEHLRGWDGHLEAGSVAPTLCQVCILRALHVIFDGHLSELAPAYIGLGLTALGEHSPYHDRSIVRLLDLLDGKGSDHWLRDPVSGQKRPVQEVLHQALRETLALLEAELGADMDRWTWGRVNRTYFSHPVGEVKPLNLLFNKGPYPASGGPDTLLRASSRPEYPFPAVEVGDALRFIADPGDWEQCRIVIPGGQSGHVASRHYADLLPLWREGWFQAMPFRRDQVERYAKKRLILAPR